MAHYKINWTIEAELDLMEILDFYIQRNGTALYSRKLYSRIKKTISTLSKNPNIGLKTEYESVRALVTGDYQIIYEITQGVVLISMIWDCRRNPENKKIGKRIHV